MDNATLAVRQRIHVQRVGAGALTALMVAGRVGASMAAELGTMKVTEQIDALRTLATHPVDYLVVPRLLAALTTLPLLTVGVHHDGNSLRFIVVGVFLLDIDPAFLFNNMVKYTGSIEL